MANGLKVEKRKRCTSHGHSLKLKASTPIKVPLGSTGLCECKPLLKIGTIWLTGLGNNHLAHFWSQVFPAKSPSFQQSCGIKTTMSIICSFLKKVGIHAQLQVIGQSSVLMLTSANFLTLGGNRILPSLNLGSKSLKALVPNLRFQIRREDI